MLIGMLLAQSPWLLPNTHLNHLGIKWPGFGLFSFDIESCETSPRRLWLGTIDFFCIFETTQV